MTNQLWKPPVATAAPVDSSLNRYRAFAMYGFFAAALLDGMLSSAGIPIWKKFAVSLPMATAATMWCTVDASSRGDYYPHALRWVTMFTWPIALPIYVIQTRKGRGVLLVVLAAVATAVLEAIGLALGRP